MSDSDEESAQVDDNNYVAISTVNHWLKQL